MIEISGLTRYYGDLCALDHISLTIERGKILGLLGPNGAGKTTAMRILTGFLAPTEGTVTVKGHSIDSEMLEIKKLIGYLPESAPVYQDMLVYDYLQYVADIREMPAGEPGRQDKGDRRDMRPRERDAQVDPRAFKRVQAAGRACSRDDERSGDPYPR